MAVYIKGISVISPQPMFGEQAFPSGIVTHSGSGYMKCIEPSYRDFIDPMVARRMSRIVKMGVYCARKCMNETGVLLPDAIIAGTGLGCLEDTGKFLESIFSNQEKLLNPTPFIQSTHNTVAGAIALAVKCHGYNATYTQRGISFESALQDALLLIENNPLLNVLAGGFDEVTATSFELTSRMGLWKNHPVNSDRLYEYNTRGSLAGEGAAFLMLSGEKKPNEVCIKSVSTFYNVSIGEVDGMILEVMNKNGIRLENIDLVLMGLNGDSRTDRYYNKLIAGMFKLKPVTAYKHLCGEYDTSASFALWLSWYILNYKIPALPAFTVSLPGNAKSVLIYNQVQGKYHSLYHLEKC